jgi:DNA-damage-inducible protein D
LVVQAFLRADDHFGDANEMVRVQEVDQFAGIRNMVGIRRRNISSKSSEWFEAARKTIHELGGTMPENLPVAESIKKVVSREKKRLKLGQTK